MERGSMTRHKCVAAAASLMTSASSEQELEELSALECTIDGEKGELKKTNNSIVKISETEGKCRS